MVRKCDASEAYKKKRIHGLGRLIYLLDVEASLS